MKIGIIRINFPERKMDYNEVWEIMQKAEILKGIEELTKEVEEKGLEQKLVEVAGRLEKEGYSVSENFNEGTFQLRYETGKKRNRKLCKFYYKGWRFGKN